MTGPRLGKDALLDAAAQLFDELGVDVVSLSEINRVSGHRNKSATSYHFGTKDEVVRALVARSIEPSDLRRVELLDELERTDPDPPARAVVEVAVAPLSENLASFQGRRHLRLLGQLVGHPRYVASTQEVMRATTGLTRCGARLARTLDDLPTELRLERVVLLVAFAVRSYADQARLVDAERPPRPPLPTETFTANLTDLIVNALAAPSTAS